MPIAIRVVSQDQFQTWYAAARDDLTGANRALMAAIGNGKDEDKVAAAE